MARDEERLQMWEGRKHEKHEDTKGNTKKHEHETRKDENTKSTKGASPHSFVSFALSNFRVSKPLELNPHDNQGVRFLLHDLEEGLSWEESAARDEL